MAFGRVSYFYQKKLADKRAFIGHLGNRDNLMKTVELKNYLLEKLAY